jgi:hypothetical protein
MVVCSAGLVSCVEIEPHGSEPPTAGPNPGATAPGGFSESGPPSQPGSTAGSTLSGQLSPSVIQACPGQAASGARLWLSASEPLTAIAADETFVYAAVHNQVVRLKRDGLTCAESFLTASEGVTALALAQQQLYVMRSGDVGLAIEGASTLSAGTLELVLSEPAVLGVASTTELVSDGSRLFFARGSNLMRLSVPGSAPPELLAQSVEGAPSSLLPHGDNLYWVTSGRVTTRDVDPAIWLGVSSAPVLGGVPNTLSTSPCAAIAADKTQLFCVTGASYGADGASAGPTRELVELDASGAPGPVLASSVDALGLGPRFLFGAGPSRMFALSRTGDPPYQLAAEAPTGGSRLVVQGDTAFYVEFSSSTGFWSLRSLSL